MPGRTGQLTRQAEGLLLLVAVFTSILWLSAAPVASAKEAAASSDLLGPARVALADGQPQKALELAEGARRAGADPVAVLLLKAEIFGQLQQTEKQQQMLKAAIARDESLCLPRLVLGSMAERRGLWQEAERYYQEAITAQSSSRAAYLRLSRLYERHGQPMRALTMLRQGVAANPEDIGLLQTLGNTLKRRGMLPEAESVYGQILAAGDDQAKAVACRHLGDIYAQVGLYTDAFDCYVWAEELLGAESVAQEGYARIFHAADQAVAAALVSGWQQFAAYNDGGPVAREDVYIALQEAISRVDQMKGFLEKIEPPPRLEEAPAQRKLFYAVAREALVTAQIYLDTGKSSLLSAAQRRRAQADQERQQIRGSGDQVE